MAAAPAYQPAASPPAAAVAVKQEPELFKMEEDEEERRIPELVPVNRHPTKPNRQVGTFRNMQLVLAVIDFSLFSVSAGVRPKLLDWSFKWNLEGAAGFTCSK